MNLVSDTTFKWILTCLTFGLSAPWMIYDTINLIRTRKLDRAEASVRDRHFGYAIGILIGAIGVIGTLRFQGVL